MIASFREEGLFLFAVVYEMGFVELNMALCFTGLGFYNRDNLEDKVMHEPD
jgi:hypothetical protein